MVQQTLAKPAPAEAAQEIREHGSTVLREAWPAEKLAAIRAAIVNFTEWQRQRVQAGRLAPNERMYVAHGAGTFSGLSNAGFIKPDILPDLFRGSPFHDICRAYFGDEAFYSVTTRLGFRNHDPRLTDRSFIPYHQDSYTQDVRTPSILNCWMTLDPAAGRDAPGLEVVRHTCAPDFPRKDLGLRSENAAYDFITIDRDDIVKAYGDNFLAPEFEIGDGLVFSQDVIHRTYVTPQMTQPRINFELRVFSANSLAPGVTIESLGPSCIKLA